MKIVVPMAGKGTRFIKEANKNPEYKKPKPLINIKGKPMIMWALESLPFLDLPKRSAQTEFKVKPKDLIFISLKHQQDEYQIADKMKELISPDITVILISKVTRGALETALAAKTHIDTEEDFIISDCDHHFDGTNLYNTILNKKAQVDGIIPVWEPLDDEPKWSYTLFNDDCFASAVGEKDAELAKKGAYANIGAYYFSSGKNFIEDAEEMISAGDMRGAEGKEEFYVAPLYDRMIKKGRTVKAAIVPGVWGLGTPKDVAHFEDTF